MINRRGFISSVMAIAACCGLTMRPTFPKIREHTISIHQKTDKILERVIWEDGFAMIREYPYSESPAWCDFNVANAARYAAIGDKRMTKSMGVSWIGIPRGEGIVANA